MQNNRRRQIFPCRSEQCQYSSRDFNKTLNHVWDKNGLMAGFSHECGISDCTKKYRNIQSYRRHVRDRHTWFYDLYIRRYD